MRLSKTIVKAEKAPQKVLEFVPPKFEIGATEQAKAYLAKKQGADFRMSDVIRVQTGVEQMEATLVEESVEQMVLERLKEVQETAYQEAYQLGLDEGRKKSFEENSEMIKSRLENVDKLLISIGDLKKELIAQNESHLVQLAFQMAKRLAHVEVQADPKVVVDVIRQAIEHAQVEESVTVQVAPEQLEFLESLKKETGREFEFMKKLKLEPVANVSLGGAVITTNYGEIDARFEERVNKLWSVIAENLNRVKDKVSST